MFQTRKDIYGIGIVRKSCIFTPEQAERIKQLQDRYDLTQSEVIRAALDTFWSYSNARRAKRNDQ